MTDRGLVVQRHRREVVLEADDGRNLKALLRGRRLKPLVGDDVRWTAESDNTVVIEEILPRRSLLERIDSRGRAEGVAANLSLLLAVAAPQPEPDWQLIDRYLAASHLLGIGAAIVCNKADLGLEQIEAQAAIYERIGYSVIRTSAGNGSGLESLACALEGERGVLLGQSGVGKSSLINALLKSQAQAVGRLSPRKGIGRHTTTSSVLYRLANGGEIIDSPGVRRYAPPIPGSAELAAGFPEFQALLGRCRFNDCRHTQEPGCAIRAALSDGKIAPSRYDSFIALRTTVEALQAEAPSRTQPI